MQSLYLKKKDLPVVSVVEPTNAFMYAILLVDFRSQEYIDLGEGSPCIIYLAFLCGLFCYHIAYLMKEPSKSHVVTIPFFPSLSNRG